MKKALVGMLHLPALPGSPGSQESLGDIETRLVAEARLLSEVGFQSAILENFGDVPFFKDRVDPSTIAGMTRLACAVRTSVPGLGLGINVLRNDAGAALAVATAAEAAFIRVNVHVGAAATDQGIVEGRAAETLRLRRALGGDVAIWADVHVKHGRSLAHGSIADEAEDAVRRGLASAVIVSGRGTGEATSIEDVRAVASRGLGVPVYVGSGVDADNVESLLDAADGVIVGTSIKVDGRTTNPIDRRRAEALVERARLRML